MPTRSPSAWPGGLAGAGRKRHQLGRKAQRMLPPSSGGNQRQYDHWAQPPMPFSVVRSGQSGQPSQASRRAGVEDGRREVGHTTSCLRPLCERLRLILP
ncbi:hypothetical protein NDU88_001142 [Pleurodeles waltl]|uniref:Uncharacterized protein n=1 Tax=Pleurodeles waltl TaxID=8319 RepID=A0AAV7US08_PLEWA|nr:hypothetical protein NDU88_001142 [Pleurodeles waltl]